MLGIFGMSTKSDTRSYNNPLKPTYGERWQNERLTGTVYTEGKGTEAWDALFRSLRRGAMVEVVHLFLLGPTKGSIKKRLTALLKRAAGIRKRGCILIETATGMRSDKPDQWDAMLVTAREMLGKTKRAKGSGKTGRPSELDRIAALRGVPVEVLREKCEGMWQSRRYDTRIEAAAAISDFLGVEKGVGWCYFTFGKPDKPK